MVVKTVTAVKNNLTQAKVTTVPTNTLLKPTTTQTLFKTAAPVTTQNLISTGNTPTATVVNVSMIAKQNAQTKATSSPKVSGGTSSSGGGSSSGGSTAGTSKATTPVTLYEGSDEFPIPPQVCYIYDKSQDTTYMFDGVFKVAHSMSLKVEEEVTENKDQYVNNAKNEPNKVVFDVIMSDVYTSRDALTNKDKTRSVSALITLNNLKRSRQLVDVITNLMTYNNMLLAGISLTQDDTTTHFGWYGQLTFQEKYESTGSGNSSSATSKNVTSGSTSTRTPSVWVTWIGANAV